MDFQLDRRGFGLDVGHLVVGRSDEGFCLGIKDGIKRMGRNGKILVWQRIIAGFDPSRPSQRLHHEFFIKIALFSRKFLRHLEIDFACHLETLCCFRFFARSMKICRHANAELLLALAKSATLCKRSATRHGDRSCDECPFLVG